MNVLIDTNVLLSAALRDRLPERVVRFVATTPSFRWLITPDIRREYIDVLSRPKFGLSPEALQQWPELVDMRSVVVSNPVHDVEFPRDPKDAPFVAAAIATSADYLITGDRDLLDTRLSITTRMVSVTDFAADFSIS